MTTPHIQGNEEIVQNLVAKLESLGHIPPQHSAEEVVRAITTLLTTQNTKQEIALRECQAKCEGLELAIQAFTTKDQACREAVEEVNRSWREDPMTQEHHAQIVANAIEKEREEGQKIVYLILPFAKGYVAQHAIGSNRRYIEIAESYLTPLPTKESEDEEGPDAFERQGYIPNDPGDEKSNPMKVTKDSI